MKPILPALALALLVTACSSKDEGPQSCPPVSILSDAQSLTRFRPGPGRDVTDIELEAEIAGFTGECVFKKDRVDVVLQLAIDARRGPAAQGRSTEISYFVALPAFFPNAGAKQVFTTTLDFPETATMMRVKDEEVSVSIPLSVITKKADSEVLLGLQLSPDQLEHNRAVRR